MRGAFVTACTRVTPREEEPQTPWGSGGPGFESRHPDQSSAPPSPFVARLSRATGRLDEVLVVRAHSDICKRWKLLRTTGGGPDSVRLLEHMNPVFVTHRFERKCEE